MFSRQRGQSPELHSQASNRSGLLPTISISSAPLRIDYLLQVLCSHLFIFYRLNNLLEAWDLCLMSGGGAEHHGWSHRGHHGLRLLLHHLLYLLLWVFLIVSIRYVLWKTCLCNLQEGPHLFVGFCGIGWSFGGAHGCGSIISPSLGGAHGCGSIIRLCLCRAHGFGSFCGF